MRSYTIFLDPATSDLFAYVELESEERWQAIAQTDVCRRWWRYMREIMPSNPDDSPVSRELRPVFHIESGGPAVSAEVDTHFAIDRAVPARDGHVLLGRERARPGHEVHSLEDGTSSGHLFGHTQLG